jgi:hypothetical protein
MCGPALGLIGAGVSAFGSIYSGMAQSAGYKATAKAQQMQAQSEVTAGSYESARAGERIDRMQGKQVAAYAGMGLDMSGTPSDVIADTRTEGEMDKAAIRTNWQQKSNVSDYGAKISKMNAKSAMMGGIIGAGTSLASGFSSATRGAFG